MLACKQKASKAPFGRAAGRAHRVKENDQIAGDFRRAMRRFTSAVTVISLAKGTSRYGMTATAVTSLTMAPPALLACVNNGGLFYQSLADTDRFCVNILHWEQADISKAFGSPLTHDQRFAHGRWASDEYMVPFLRDAQASIFCRRVQLVPFGSHDIVIGQVYDACFRSQITPLLYCDGAYVQPALAKAVS